MKVSTKYDVRFMVLVTGKLAPVLIKLVCVANEQNCQETSISLGVETVGQLLITVPYMASIIPYMASVPVLESASAYVGFVQ